MDSRENLINRRLPAKIRDGNKFEIVPIPVDTVSLATGKATSMSGFIANKNKDFHHTGVK
jgi:hypothetical protein